MAEPNIISFEYVFTGQITRAGNGGIIFNEKGSMSLVVHYCSFASCHITETSFSGGVIYFYSTRSLIEIDRVQANDCSSYSGHVIYVKNSEISNSNLSYISTSNTFGTERACIWYQGSNSRTRFYNSTSCRSDVHCNLHFFSAESSDTAYINIFKCQCDILYGVDVSKNTPQLFKFGNFIENSKSQGRVGFLYTHSDASVVFSCSNICFKSNTHTLIFSLQGTILIQNSTYDSQPWMSQGQGIVTTNLFIQTSTDPVIYDFLIFDGIDKSCFHCSKKKFSSSVFLFIFFSTQTKNN